MDHFNLDWYWPDEPLPYWEQHDKLHLGTSVAMPKVLMVRGIKEAPRL
jgi:hypothetical protein